VRKGWSLGAIALAILVTSPANGGGDTTPPDTTIGDVSYTAGIPTWSLGSTEEGSSFECSLEQTESGTFHGYPVEELWEPCSGPAATHTETTLTNGDQYWLYVRARDGSGNVDPTPDVEIFRADTLKPVVGATLIVDDNDCVIGPDFFCPVTSDTEPSFNFYANESWVGFECSIDESSFGSCTDGVADAGSGGTHAITTALLDGPHVFAVRGTDDHANTSDPAVVNFTVDTVAPEVTFTTGPSEGALVATRTPSFGWTLNEDVNSMFCLIDDGPDACNSANSSGSFYSTDGFHTFGVTATDLAGNFGGGTRSFTIDTVGPETTIDSARVRGRRVTVAFSGTDLHGPSSFECSVDGNAYTPCDSPSTFRLKRGRHTIRVRAVDDAGNRDETPASKRVRVT
jgi:hypothetical protein